MTPGDLLAGRIKEAVQARYGGRHWAEVVIDVDYPHEAYAYVCWPAEDDTIAFVKVFVGIGVGLESTWDQTIDNVLECVGQRKNGEQW